jgi:hypothetical protein
MKINPSALSRGLNINLETGALDDDNKLPKLDVRKEIDLFTPKDSLNLINNWDVVENGKLRPKQSKNDTGLLHFKIPLMLRTIGACNFNFLILGYEEGKEENEYRLIPLGIFKGGLKILIFLNTTAFSVMTNVKEFEVLDIVNLI